MIVWGISAYSHDASLSVFKDNELVFASQSERFNKIKNSEKISSSMIEYVINSGLKPDKVYFYEKPYLKALRQVYSKQFNEIKNTLDVPRKLKNILKNHIGYTGKIEYVSHHKSHALLAKLSGFEDAMVVVIDAIGEFATTSIWKYTKNPFQLKCVWRKYYPTSLGLFYSAFTKRIGLRPNEEEYIAMAMSAFGASKLEDIIDEEFFVNDLDVTCNLHKGIGNYLDGEKKEDLAYAVQDIIEEKIISIMEEARNFNHSSNLVYAGGVALNCVANTRISKSKLFDKIFIFPNPSDSGSAVGCALKHFENEEIIWNGSPYLGYNIEGNYPVEDLLESLLQDGIIGVANGKAEFGARALGNRSIFADPRTLGMKDRVNEIKYRELFRPFAPIVIKEYASEYFDIDKSMDNSYMQYTCKCKFPDKYPAICHVDGTSRIQTITKKQHPKLYELVYKWYIRTGCPMLLNTSLNIKGKPIVNNVSDAKIFERKTGLKIFF